MTTPAIDDDDFTELVDFRPDRVDLVGKGANGIGRFLVAKEDASGLLPAAYVRDLIAKGEPEPSGREQVTMPNGITVSGSPADIAAFIHKAAQRAAERDAPAPGDPEAAEIAKALAEYEAVIKAKYNAEDLRRMAANGEAMDDGSYPVGDEADLDKAIRAVGRGGADHDAIRRHVIKRAKALGKSSMIPDNWAADGSLKEKVSKDMGPELDDGVDGMDPTVPLAEPEEMAPGDPTMPGSPAWESIDAATACKWTSILARARVAVDVLAERELLEAASADPDDAEHAWDLQDVCCAIDYAISVLAPFAVAEQSAADCGEAELAAIGKALAVDMSGPLGVIEGLAAVRKSGRVLSSANEAAIRGAVESLQKVLASLPEAPVAKQAKTEEGTVPGTQTAGDAPATQVAKEGAPATPEAQAADTGPVSAGGTTGMGEPRATGPAAALPGDGPQAARPGDVPDRQVVKGALKVAVYDMGRRLVHVRGDRISDPAAYFARVAKADGDGGDGKVTMQAVFDEEGNLVGIVDPADITPVSGAGGGKGGDSDGMDGEPQPGPAGAAADGDMTPQPPAAAGTPAEDVAKSGAADVITVTADVLKSIAEDAARTALQAQGAAHQEVVAKMAADKGELAEELRVVKARLEQVENTPAAPKVFTNGQVPPASQLRGQDQGTGQPVDVAKAAELKGTLYRGTAAEQNAAFHEMQRMAVDQLAVLQRR